MQGAARKVAEENISLRALLGLYGADNGRIEAFLRKGDVSFIEKEYSSPLSSEGIGQDRYQSENACYRKLDTGAVGMRASHGIEKDLYSQRAMDGSERAGIDTVQIESDAPPLTVTMPGERTDPNTIRHAEPTDLTGKICPNIDTDQSIAPSPALPTDSIDLSTCREDSLQSSTGQDEISCLTAAEIIAGMRGHDDSEEVWSELGCTSSKGCMIKNVAVFQIMDQ